MYVFKRASPAVTQGNVAPYHDNAIIYAVTQGADHCSTADSVLGQAPYTVALGGRATCQGVLGELHYPLCGRGRCTVSLRGGTADSHPVAESCPASMCGWASRVVAQGGSVADCGSATASVVVRGNHRRLLLL